MTFNLSHWSEAYRDAFAEMQSDSEVMADLGGPFDRAASDAKFDRYRDAWTLDGVSRWAVIDPAGTFLGYAGVMKHSDADHPLGPHHEVGWRFRRDAWGKGLATQSAERALAHAWTVVDVLEILSYTAPDNRRSQKVMDRLNLRRDKARDFTARYPRGDWSGLVWVAERPQTPYCALTVAPLFGGDEGGLSG
jgi:RimJ/RimL family protein N-acetyltransferase